MEFDSVIAMLLVGAIAGWIAGKLMKGRGFGLIGNIIVGIVGAFLAGLKEKGQLLASGPFDPRTGGMLIMQADSAEDAGAITQEDPFRKNEIAKYEVRGWKPTIGVERFE